MSSTSTTSNSRKYGAADIIIIDIILYTIEKDYLEVDPTEYSDGNYLELSNFTKEAFDFRRTETYKKRLKRARQYLLQTEKTIENLQEFCEKRIGIYESTFQGNIVELGIHISNKTAANSFALEEEE